MSFELQATSLTLRHEVPRREEPTNSKLVARSSLRCVRPVLGECVDPGATAVAVEGRRRAVALFPDEAVERTAFWADPLVFRRLPACPDDRDQGHRLDVGPGNRVRPVSYWSGRRRFGPGAAAVETDRHRLTLTPARSSFRALCACGPGSAAPPGSPMRR